jgi:hypothetical protein
MTGRERRIQERARRLWEEAGEPQGQDERFWLAAEQEIDAEDSAGAVRRDDPAGSPVGTPPRR